MEVFRKLATIQRIKEISPIEGADAIEVATINGWKVVVAKNVGHKVNDLVVYCEIDSFLPIRDEFEFLRKSSYKKMSDGTEGFRLKTIKLRGQISQGLILPSTIFCPPEMNEVDKEIFKETFNLGEENIGNDVTSLLNIIKYEPPIPAGLSGKVKGLFPSFIQKTDEERIQNLLEEYEEYKKYSFYVTEKLDGSSATFYIKYGNFGVCSRNLDLLESEENTFWRVAKNLDIQNKLFKLNKNICIQGELIGEGIQGNPYKIKGHTVKFFTGFNIDSGTRIQFKDFIDLLKELSLDSVPIISDNFKLPENFEELLKYSENKSVLNDMTEREGIVIRSMDSKISFKVISNQFLLNEK